MNMQSVDVSPSEHCAECGNRLYDLGATPRASDGKPVCWPCRKRAMGSLARNEPAAPAQAAINLLPAALTQAEMEALKPGPRPQDGTGSYCDVCRLCPPFGYVSTDRNVFYCDGCYKKATGKK